MKSTLFIVKNKLNAGKKEATEGIHRNAEISYKKSCKGEYILWGQNKLNVLEKCKGNVDNHGLIVIVSYRQDGKEIRIQDLFAGHGYLRDHDEKSPKLTMTYEMKVYLEDGPMIENLLDKLELDLEQDYGMGEYVIVNHFKPVLRSFEDLIISSSGRSHGKSSEDGYGEEAKITVGKDTEGGIRTESTAEDGTKEETEEETEADTEADTEAKAQADTFDCYELSRLAQKHAQCRRKYPIEEDRNRSAYQHDRERIVNSKSFRRLVDKAQVFSARKGDHYRTRMTHTLEVNQIAKAIAFALGLNLDLTEAIALGHDLGHTPFGHQGERTLQDILSGAIPCIDFPGGEAGCFGGFKHNYQGLRVLNKMEEKYIGHEGLNVSYQVMEGVLKHTKLVKDVSIYDFVDPDIAGNLHLGSGDLSCLDGRYVCTTLEGQTVSLADEIAQRGHDVDDAISSGLISVEELIEYLDLEKFSGLRQVLEREKDAIDRYVRSYVSYRELTAARMVSAIVHYFITDAIEHSKECIRNYTGRLTVCMRSVWWIYQKKEKESATTWRRSSTNRLSPVQRWPSSITPAAG